ncbi:hypothetical protein EDB87DRAFT_1636408 [Lactarius vividus]|nr:hypothetical protein EDB87DRAFT_1636408 [Lactarius vividus]
MSSDERLAPGFRHVDAFGSGEIIEEVSYVTLISGTVFQGTHRSLLGTELLCTEDKDAHERVGRKITHLACCKYLSTYPLQISQSPALKVHLPSCPICPRVARGREHRKKKQKVDGRNVVKGRNGSILRAQNQVAVSEERKRSRRTPASSLIRFCHREREREILTRFASILQHKRAFENAFSKLLGLGR